MAEMTAEQALNEAVLRFVRRTRRRMHSYGIYEFNNLWNSLPEPVRNTLLKAEREADLLRDRHPATAEGLAGLDWPAEPDYEDEHECQHPDGGCTDCPELK